MEANTKKAKYQNLSNQVCNYPRLSNYYKVVDLLEDYHVAIALYGIRRTGKTVVLDQLWQEYKCDTASYIRINHNAMTCQDLVNYIQKKNLKLLLVDEVTRLKDFDTEISVVLDHCIGHGVKLVVAGTEAYMLYLSTLDEAFGRLEFVSFNPTLFTDLKVVKPSSTFEEYCMKGLGLQQQTAERVKNNLYVSLMGSIQKSVLTRKLSLRNCSEDSFKMAIQSIIEYIIGVMKNEIAAPNYKTTVLSGCDCNYKGNIRNIDKFAIRELFSMLVNLNIINVMDQKTFTIKEDGQILRENKAVFYSTQPALYYDLLLDVGTTYADFSTDDELLDVKGALFESAVVTQLLRTLENCSNYTLYSLRNEGLEKHKGEIDLVIEKHNGYNEDGIADITLNLIEFKFNGRKRGMHFQNKVFKEYAKKYNKVNCYTVYCVGSSNRPSSIHVEDFLDNLDAYLS